MNVRAKMRCESVTSFATTARRTFFFSAVYDTSIPEDQRYAQYTPYAKLEITVDNPAINWEAGKSYYLDLTEVQETTQAA